MRIITLDISAKRIGIAISDEDLIFISLVTILHKNHKRELAQLLKKYPPDLVIIGLPTFGNNRLFIKHFTHSLRNILKPFIFIDESYSTTQAYVTEEYGHKSVDEKVAIYMLKWAMQELDQNGKDVFLAKYNNPKHP